MPISTTQAKLAAACFDPHASPRSAVHLVAAITVPSDNYDMTARGKAIAALAAAGKDPTEIDNSQFLRPRPWFAYHIDLCTWYLKFVQVDGRGFTRFMTEADDGRTTQINGNLMARIRDPQFDLAPTGSRGRLINVLTESLAGTLLHEV